MKTKHKKEKTLSKKLNKTIALVTGASRGLGKAISLALAGQGATVLLTATNKTRLQQVADDIDKTQGKSEILPADLTNEKDIISLIEQIKNKFGKLDILINNAGVTQSSKLEDTPTEKWDRCIAVNARAPFILCRQALPLLHKSDEAAIINIASVVGVKGYPLQSAYTASKHALRGMTISLAEELKQTSIRVHLLCPGGIDTDMVTQVRPDIKKDELMKPEEIAELVIYLLTHRGNAVLDELRIRRAASNPWFD